MVTIDVMICLEVLFYLSVAELHSNAKNVTWSDGVRRRLFLL